MLGERKSSAETAQHFLATLPQPIAEATACHNSMPTYPQNMVILTAKEKPGGEVGKPPINPLLPLV